MPMSPAASLPGQDNSLLLGGADELPRHPIFRARNLELAREYLSGVLGPHRVTYLTRDRRLDFRHRLAKLGAVELNALQYGGDVMVDAPHIPDFYLLEIMLAGNCSLSQGGRSLDMPAGSVAVINPRRPFTKFSSPAAHKLMIRIERSLLERELQAWTGREPKELIEFDQSQAFAMEKVATLTHAVRLLCDGLRDESSSLDHPLVRDRVASTLASALLVEMPHNYSRAFEAAETLIAPASVRRAERRSGRILSRKFPRFGVRVDPASLSYRQCRRRRTG
jgi:AraC-binding-like domain